MRGISIGVRLMLGYGTLILLLAISTAVALSFLTTVDRRQAEVSRGESPYIGALRTVATTAKAAANDERGYLLAGDPKFTEEAVGRVDKIDEIIETAKRDADPAKQAELTEISTQIHIWFDAVRAELERYERDPAGAREIALGDNRDLRKAYEGRIDEAIAASDGRLQAANGALVSSIGGARRAQLGFLAVAVIVAVALAMAISRSITRPLRRILAALRRVADGTSPPPSPTGAATNWGRSRERWTRRSAPWRRRSAACAPRPRGSRPRRAPSRR
jgi:methyl-accepting chemotaxis protein